MTRYTRTVRRKLPNRGRARAHPDPGYATRAAWRFTSRTTTSDGGVSRKWTVKGAPYAFFACRLQAPAVLFDDLPGAAKASPREGSRECLIPALLGWFAAGPPPVRRRRFLEVRIQMPESGDLAVPNSIPVALARSAAYLGRHGLARCTWHRHSLSGLRQRAASAVLTRQRLERPELAPADRLLQRPVSGHRLRLNQPRPLR